MTRANKNTRNRAKAKEITALHLKGEKGPSSTTPLHGKRYGYRNNPETAKRLAEQMKRENAKHVKTGGEKILDGAGSAAN